MTKKIQFRRGTASAWTSANTVLSSGEIGYEEDSNKFKIGDGTKTWTQSSYFINSSHLATTLSSYVTSDSLSTTLSNYVTSTSLSTTLGSYSLKAFTFNAQTGTNYTIALSDDSKLIEISNSSANTITVPPASSVSFSSGSQINIVQTGSGQTTITPTVIATAPYSSGGALAATTVVIGTVTQITGPIAVGQLITGTGIAANTLVTNVTGSTITFDQPTTAQISGTISFRVGVVGTPTLKMRTKYSSATLIKRSSTDGWILIGDLSAT
jgi:hypothetical protein